MSTTHAPLALHQIAADLARPFALDQVEVKPGATAQATDDRPARALALAYVDLRAYQDRLDEVAGPENWSVEYRQLGNKSVICRLTICGVVREDVGEPSRDGDNPATEALAQAFKRACSAFGLGRYLYRLPQLWVDFDPAKKRIVNPARATWEMYQAANLLTADQRRQQPPAVARPQRGGGAGR
jgi:hypothetical protein